MCIKDKIIFTSIELFNKYGVNNVSLKKISDEVNINTGHLYYYFKRKQDILLAILDKLVTDFNQFISEDFKDTDYIKTMIDNTIQSHKNYIFFYRDLFVIFSEYPEFKDIYEKRFERRMQQIIKIFEMYIEKGFIQPSIKSKLELLSYICWFNSTFWSLSLEISSDTDSDKKLRTSFKTLFSPYLTKKGKKAIRF